MSLYKSPLKPYDPIVPEEDSGLTRYLVDSFAQSGVDSFTQPPSQDQSLLMQANNVLPSITGTLQRRWGYGLLGSPGTAFRWLFSYRDDNAPARRIVATAVGKVTSLNEDGSTHQASVFVPSGSAAPYATNSRSTMYFADGTSADLKKWDGTNVTKWGIDAPTSVISVGTPGGGGAITINYGRLYFVVYKNSTTGQHSDLSPVSVTSGPLVSNTVPLSNIQVSSDAQVDKKIVLATRDGGDETLLFELVELANATTTYTDNTDEVTLLQQNVYQETDASGNSQGVADNQPPPNGLYPTKHRGRIFMVVGQSIYFSKSIDELTTSTGTIVGRYEECWPAFNFLDTGESTAETIKGLLSDGNALYIGTERRVYRLDGDGPSNFSSPQAVFNDVGVANQASWKIVFNEGQPIGMMWLTPDGRVMMSNGNTYQEVGTPLRGTLSGLNVSAVSNAAAMGVTSGPYSFYMLGVPTGTNTQADTVLVYDLRLQRWFTWTPTDTATAMLYNVNASGIPQALFVAASGKLYNYSSSFTTDRTSDNPVAITSTVQTSWLHMGEPTKRKVLNELEVLSGDTATKVTLEGASLASDFASPYTVTANASLFVSPFGPLKLRLTGLTTKHRFYRIKVVSTGTSPEVLDGYSVQFYPLHSI